MTLSQLSMGDGGAGPRGRPRRGNRDPRFEALYMRSFLEMRARGERRGPAA